jgi:putative hydrolase of the HAD superfamily
MKSYFTDIDLSKYSTVLFDLDNTIYDEITYLFSCYDAIGKELKKLGFAEYLKKSFTINGRKNLFDKALLHFEVDNKEMQTCLLMLKTTRLDHPISTYPYFIPFANQLLETNKSVFVVTNGHPLQQRNKVNQINWEFLKDKMTFIFANEIEAKPSPASFLYIKKKFGIKQEETLMIGDSECDSNYSKNCNIDFIHVQEFHKRLQLAGGE